MIKVESIDKLMSILKKSRGYDGVELSMRKVENLDK